MIMIRSKMPWLIIATLAGCGIHSEDVRPASRPQPLSEPAAPEPVPFENLPLASDDSYESPRATDGAQAGEVREFTKLNTRFCWCPAGEFQMGSSDTAPDHLLNETQHNVTLTRGFWMQQTEVTQNQYSQLMGTNPSFYKGEQNPVDSVTWPPRPIDAGAARSSTTISVAIDSS